MSREDSALSEDKIKQKEERTSKITPRTNDQLSSGVSLSRSDRRLGVYRVGRARGTRTGLNRKERTHRSGDAGDVQDHSSCRIGRSLKQKPEREELEKASQDTEDDRKETELD